MSAVDEAIALLKSRAATMRCSELEAALKSVGFNVYEGTKGKHRMVDHDRIPEVATSFDGGHGKDAQVKSNYVHSMRKLIERYQAELTDYLEKK